MAYVPLSGSKVAVRYGAQPEEAEGDMVSGTFFSGLGVSLPLGRGFSDQDESRHAPLAVISYNYWTRRFTRDPGVLGKTLFVNGLPMTIVGVAAEGFEGLEPGGSTDFWIPLQSRSELNAWGNPPEDGKTYIADPTWWCMRLIARLAPGASRAQALAQLQPVFQKAAYVGLGTPMEGEKLPVLSVADAKSFPGYDDEYGKPLRMLMAMVGLVLLVALANVVMLLMARNASRQREFSVRQALGAGRGELLCSNGYAAAGPLGADRVQPCAGQDGAAVHAGCAGGGSAAVWSGAAARGSGRQSGAGAQDLRGHIKHRRGQIAHRQNHCRFADGPVRGAAGGRWAADAHAAQPGKYAPRHEGRWPGRLRR
jgi:hypothetical protein